MGAGEQVDLVGDALPALGQRAEERLDGLLMFQQESMYWLTGYDTFGFCFFQCLVVAADGQRGAPQQHHRGQRGAPGRQVADVLAQLVEAAHDAKDGVDRMRVIVRDLRTLSRDEDDRLAGSSHFLEHLLFKGTRSRSAKRAGRRGATSIATAGRTRCWKVPSRTVAAPSTTRNR